MLSVVENVAILTQDHLNLHCQVPIRVFFRIWKMYENLPALGSLPFPSALPFPFSLPLLPLSPSFPLKPGVCESWY